MLAAIKTFLLPDLDLDPKQYEQSVPSTLEKPPVAPKPRPDPTAPPAEKKP